MKKSFKLISLLLAVILLAALTACKTNEPEPKPADNTDKPAATEAADQTTDEPTEEPTEQAPADYTDITGVDFSAPSITVNYDDFEGMQDFIKKMQNYEIAAGTIVEIFGETGSSTMWHSIVIPDAEGTTRVGPTFVVVGMDDADFPASGTRIHIVGVVRANEYGINVLVVPADHFEVTAD